MELDKIITGDSAEVLQSFPTNCIDLTVTSPPYDNLRTYNGFTFDFETIARELYRVTNPGGVVVWVVGDATINGSETGTSFRQALKFMEIGFNLHDTMIYKKAGGGAVGSRLSYWQSFEYMFVFCKGKINITNLIKDKKNVSFGHLGSPSEKQNNITKTRIINKKERVKEFSVRNIWIYGHGNQHGDVTNHTAPFPEALANDHILSWSNPGDSVLDCFAGSGTTLKMAKMLSRHYIGIEISPEYVALAEKRLLATKVPLFALTDTAPKPEPLQGALLSDYDSKE